MYASMNGNEDVMEYLVKQKADVKAKSKVITALTYDGLLDCLIDLRVSVLAVVSAVWLHRGGIGLTEGSQ